MEIKKNVLKFFLVLIIANIIYWVLGVIVWNIVCMVSENNDLFGVTIEKIASYSGVVGLVYFLSCVESENLSLVIFSLCAFVVAPYAVTFLITREGTWDIVRLIVTIIFHIYNIFLLSGPIYGLLVEDD